jgi:hypothetical protein
MNSTLKYLILKAVLSLVCTAVASDTPIPAASVSRKQPPIVTASSRRFRPAGTRAKIRLTYQPHIAIP